MNGPESTSSRPASAQGSRLIWAASAVCLLAFGIPYWRVPYDQVALPNTLYGPGLLLVAVCALMLCALGVARIGKVTLVVGLAVPAAVLARVIVDGLADPTSHNLWPFEIVISLVLGMTVAGIGALAGSGIARMRRNT